MEMIQKFTDKIQELSDRIASYESEVKLTDAIVAELNSAVDNLSTKDDYLAGYEEVTALASLGSEKVIDIVNKLGLDVSPDIVDTIIRILNNKVFAENKSKRYMNAFEDLKSILNLIENAIRTNSLNNEANVIMIQKLYILKKYQHYFDKDKLVEPIYKIKEFAEILRDPYYDFGYSDDDIIEIITQISIENVALSKETERRYLEEYNRALEERLTVITGETEEEIVDMQEEDIPQEETPIEEQIEEVFEEEPIISKPTENISKVNLDLIKNLDLYEQIRSKVGEELYNLELGNASRYYISKDFAKNYKDNGVAITEFKTILTMPRHYEAFLLYVMRIYCNEISEWLNEFIPESDQNDYADLINEYIASLIDFYNKYYLGYMNEKNPDIAEGNPSELETEKDSKLLLVRDSRDSVPFMDSLKKYNLSYEDVVNALKIIQDNPRNQSIVLSNGVGTKNRFRSVGNFNIIFFPYEDYIIIYDIMSKNDFDKSKHEYKDVFRKSVKLIENGGPDLRKQTQDDKELLMSASRIRGGDNNE